MSNLAWILPTIKAAWVPSNGYAKKWKDFKRYLYRSREAYCIDCLQSNLAFNGLPPCQEDFTQNLQFIYTEQSPYNRLSFLCCPLLSQSTRIEPLPSSSTCRIFWLLTKIVPDVHERPSNHTTYFITHWSSTLTDILKDDIESETIHYVRKAASFISGKFFKDCITPFLPAQLPIAVRKTRSH